MDRNSAFSVIQRALEDFSADVGRAQAEQAASETLLAAIEYELDQIRKLVADHRLAGPAPAVLTARSAGARGGTAERARWEDPDAGTQTIEAA